MAVHGTWVVYMVFVISLALHCQFFKTCIKRCCFWAAILPLGRFGYSFRFMQIVRYLLIAEPPVNFTVLIIVPTVCCLQEIYQETNQKLLHKIFDILLKDKRTDEYRSLPFAIGVRIYVALPKLLSLQRTYSVSNTSKSFLFEVWQNNFCNLSALESLLNLTHLVRNWSLTNINILATKQSQNLFRQGVVYVPRTVIFER